MRTRQFENHVAHFPPAGIIRNLVPNDAGNTFELAAGYPKFAIQRLFRQAGDKPGRGIDGSATSETQNLAIPDRPHAIELFTDHITRNINLITIEIGQHDVWRIGCD